MSGGLRALALLAGVAGCGRLIDLDDKTLEPPALASALSSRLPPRPPADSAAGEPGEYLAFAARRIQIGASDAATGKPSPSAWRSIGFDLDGESTSLLQSATGTASCQREAFSSPDVLVDGEEGRDNAFAAKLIDLLALVHPAFGATESRVNDALARRTTLTFVAVLRDLSPGPDDAHVSLGLFTGRVGPDDHPTWQGLEQTRPDYRTTLSGSAASALTLPDGYLTGDTFVSGELAAPVDGPLLLPFDPDSDGLLLHPRRLVLLVSLSRDHHEVLSATLAGALDVRDLARALLPLARARAYQPACGEDGETRLAALLARAADLRFDEAGALIRDPSLPCNAVSFGWGLDLQREDLPIQLDYIYPPVITSACAP